MSTRTIQESLNVLAGTTGLRKQDCANIKSNTTGLRIQDCLDILTAFSPDSISGLALWFKADAGVYSDAGTTLATDGQTVRQWTDFSTSAKNLTQATGAARPTYNTNMLNGKPAVTFGSADGVTHSIMQTASMTLSQPVHVFMVMKYPTFINSTGFIDGFIADRMAIYQASTGYPNISFFSGATGIPNPMTSFLVNTWGILDAKLFGTSSFLRLNNGSKVPPSAGNNLTGNPGGLTVGQELGSGFSHSVFAEILVYNVDITDEQATQINLYLSTKWGI